MQPDIYNFNNSRPHSDKINGLRVTKVIKLLGSQNDFVACVKFIKFIYIFIKKGKLTACVGMERESRDFPEYHRYSLDQGESTQG